MCYVKHFMYNVLEKEKLNLGEKFNWKIPRLRCTCIIESNYLLLYNYTINIFCYCQFSSNFLMSVFRIWKKNDFPYAYAVDDA